MRETYTYSQRQIWNSALNVSQKIFNLTNYFIEEDLKSMAETLRNKAKKFQAQLEEEIKEEECLKTFSAYRESLTLLNTIEENLIYAFDQGCITERELKTTLEAITIYTHEIKSHQNSRKGNHKLIEHLNNIPDKSDHKL